jgi:hypothetical protein
MLGPAANKLSAHFYNEKIEGRWRDRHHGYVALPRHCLRLDHRVGNHCGDDVIMTGTTALLLYLAATFGSMAFGAIIALWKEKRERR